MRLRYALLPLLAAAGLLAAPAMAQANLSGVVINEILADPNSTNGPNFDTDGDGEAETDDEFVELYNTSGVAVDLSGWQIYDNSTSSALAHTFDPGTLLEPGGYLVVVGAWDPGTPPPGIVAANVSTLGFNNDGDEAFLYDPDADAYIGAYYNGGQTGFLGPGTATNAGEDDFGGDTDGESLQRAPSGGTTIVSATPTPLGAVVVATEDGPEADASHLSAPRPNPAGTASAFVLTVAATQRVAVTVYDVTGRRVAVLLDRTVAAGEAVALALDTAALPAGVYVVQARGEAFTQARRVTVAR